MTAEHVKPLLENSRDADSLCQVEELLSRSHIPPEVLRVIRVGRLSSFPTGGVRGIVAGDFLRQLVARTVAQQTRQQVVRATAPFQYALSTRAGRECCSSGKFAVCPRWSWSQERRSDSQGSLLVQLGGLRPSPCSVHVRHSTALGRKRGISCGCFGSVSTATQSRGV